MRCYKCPTETGSIASILCPECHAKEVARIHKHDTPTTPELEKLPRYVPVMSRPNARGRRRMKNEKGIQ